MAKDLYKPTVCGVGILGEASRKGNERGYTLWASMLSRVYDRTLYPAYAGTSVDPRWHRFDCFLEDLPQIPGYALWLEVRGTSLDKDTRVAGNRHYSLDTCQFISKADNGRDVITRYKETQ